MTAFALVLLLAAGAAPPEGRSWVRRFTPSLSSGKDGVLTRHGYTRCEPMDLETTQGRRLLRLGAVTFTVRAQPGGLLLINPTLTSAVPPLELPGQCQHLLAPSAPIYAERAACQAVPSSATQRCEGERCSWEGEAPFVLSGCEEALTALTRQAARALEATHAESLRSLERLQRVLLRGGTWWVFEPDADRCVALTLAPLPEGRVSMKEGYAPTSGGRVTYQAQVTLQPLFHRAGFDSESRSFEGADGAGSSGSSPHSAGLYLGRDAVLVGTRWLFPEQNSCDSSR